MQAQIQPGAKGALSVQQAPLVCKKSKMPRLVKMSTRLSKEAKTLAKKFLCFAAIQY